MLPSRPATWLDPLRSAPPPSFSQSDAGREEEYFNMLMGGVKVTAVTPKVLNIKEQVFAHRNHFEIVELHYEEITWSYLDGSLKFRDAWSFM
jgi:type VI secretion system secreted protein Hcp